MGQTSEELRADIEERRDSMSETIDAIEDRVVPSRIVERRRAAAKDWAGGMKEKVMGTAHDANDQAGGAVQRLGDGVGRASDAVSNAPQQVQRATAGSPLIAGAVAFGVGALVAAMLPKTEPERKAVQAVQPQLDAAKGAIQEVGQHAVEAGKSSAQDAAQDLKSSATDHARSVGSDAADATDDVKARATGEVSAP